jgi:hypothetical protein
MMGVAMSTQWNRLLRRLSTSDLKKLLNAKAEIEELESRRDSLQKELTAIEKKLARLVSGEAAPPVRRAKRRAKKAVAAGTSAQKTRTKARAKKAVRKQTKPAAAGRAKRTTLEDVIVSVIREHGEPMPFKTLLDAIVKGKRFKTRSKDFGNVLRRTLSTSQRVKRKGRGVYGI